jgi:hypothetical protein
MATAKFWYVIASEPPPDEEVKKITDIAAVDVWGPFDSEPDAQAFSIDVWHDNGWESVEAVKLTPSQAAERSTSSAVIWPYKKEG